jgi:hypothetical protein
VALFFSLKSNQLLEDAMESPEAFLQVLHEHEYQVHPTKSIVQEQLAY